MATQSHSALWDRLPTPGLPHGGRLCTHEPRGAERALSLIVLTGGPGAGKTAVLTAARTMYCEHVAAIPEAATILFGGGFPRHETIAGRAAAQRAIFHVQREAERLVEEEQMAHAALCDRGTVDGVAYWPGSESEYWSGFGTSREEQIARYDVVVHLRTPEDDGGYNRSNRVRVEDVALARRIDEQILRAWDGHPNRVVIEAQSSFEDKLHEALEAIAPFLPEHRLGSAQ